MTLLVAKTLLAPLCVVAVSLAEPVPAGELVRRLAAEARAALRDAAAR